MLEISELCAERSTMTSATSKKSAIDDIDRKILSELVRDGRTSFRDLANHVHLSPNATAERVRRLESIGAIRSFRTDVDRTFLGFPAEAYIDVKLSPGTTAESFQEAITRLTGVVSAAVLTGSVDFRLRVACKGHADVVRLVEALRERAGVQETNTSMILREIEMPRLPL